MQTVEVKVRQISNNKFQIIAQTESDDVFAKNFMTQKVAEFAEKAEKCHGIPQQESDARTVPSKLIVHATYTFLSGADIQAFLKECENFT